MGKLLILDPECRDTRSHIYPTTLSLLARFEDMKCFVAVHRLASPLLRFDGDVTLWHWPDLRSLAGRVFRPVGRSARYRAGMRRRNVSAMANMVRQAGLGPGDIIISHSIWPYHAESFAGLANALGSEGPAMHIRIIDERLRQAFAREDEAGLKKLAEAARLHGKLHLYTETAEMGTFLEAACGFPVTGQWLLSMNISRPVPPATKPDPQGEFVIGLLGGKRPEQGAALIPDILVALARRQSKPKRIRVLIQSPAFVGSGSPVPAETARLMTALGALDLPGTLELEMLDTELDGATMRHTIGQCHLLLLPYDVQAYRTRGSGWITEAAMSGTPVVAPEGFAMSEWLDMAGSPRASSAIEYADAALAVARDYPHFRDAAIRTGYAMQRAIDAQIGNIRGGS